MYLTPTLLSALGLLLLLKLYGPFELGKFRFVWLPPVVKRRFLRVKAPQVLVIQLWAVSIAIISFKVRGTWKNQAPMSE